MKLRIIILALTLLSLASVIIGSYMYISLVEESILSDSSSRIASNAAVVGIMLTDFMKENQKSAKILAGMDEVESALTSQSAFTLPAVHRTLDHFARSLNVSATYLMDAGGTTIAASNRDTPKSFLGKNYAFRPYFRESISGRPWIYLALGVTSQERGAYYSHPVYRPDCSDPAGVLVIKSTVDELEHKISVSFQSRSDKWVLVDDNGLIFAANQPDWLFHFLWSPKLAQIERVLESRQFGDGPWPSLAMTRTDSLRLQDQAGNIYLYHMVPIDNLPGWRVVYLSPDPLSSGGDSLMAYRTQFIITISIMGVITVAILYYLAGLDIKRRREMSAALQRENAYMAALHETTLGLVGRLEFDELIRAVLTRAGELLGTPDGYLYLHRPKERCLELTVGIGVYKNEVGIRIKPGEGLVGRIFESGKPMVIDDYSRWGGRIQGATYDKLGSLMGMPLKIGNEIAGAIGLGFFETRRRFGKEEVDIFSRFGELATIALDNAQLYSRLEKELRAREQTEKALKSANRELHRLSVIDGLTQIANRRFFDIRLSEEWRRLMRAEHPLALLLCDVDFFKRFNDTYGHRAGDDCLRAIAQTIAGAVHRTGDLVARYGGEEFGVILSDTSAEGAQQVARKICRKIAQLNIPHSGSQVAPHITISLGGAACYPREGLTVEQLIQEADAALYAAKNSGRNRAVIHHADTELSGKECHT